MAGPCKEHPQAVGVGEGEAAQRVSRHQEGLATGAWEQGTEDAAGPGMPSLCCGEVTVQGRQVRQTSRGDDGSSHGRCL